MKQITQDEFNRKYDLHQKWLDDNSKGERLNLSNTDLRGINFIRRKNLQHSNLALTNLHSANLYSANLHSANLYSANLHSANLHSANLYSANLHSADLYSANLHSADLRWANLHSATLHSANLTLADLYSANLHSTNLSSADLRWARGVFTFLGEKNLLIYYKHSNKYKIQVGCINETLEYMQKNFKAIGKGNGYTEDEIDLYGNIISVFSKYDILE